MVKELWHKLATSLGRTLSKPDTIELLVTHDPAINYMQSYMLSLEEDSIRALELPSMLHASISADDWQKLNRAGLAHVLLENLGLSELSTPRQLELPLTMSNKHIGSSFDDFMKEENL